jgi:hypothetical protein
MAKIAIANGKNARFPTKENATTDTIKVKYGKIRFRPFNFSNLTVVSKSTTSHFIMKKSVRHVSEKHVPQ